MFFYCHYTYKCPGKCLQPSKKWFSCGALHLKKMARVAWKMAPKYQKVQNGQKSLFEGWFGFLRCLMGVLGASLYRILMRAPEVPFLVPPKPPKRGHFSIYLPLHVLSIIAWYLFVVCIISDLGVYTTFYKFMNLRSICRGVCVSVSVSNI